MSINPWFKNNNVDPQLYYTWTNMRQRCRNPNRLQWKDYGGRGISVCSRWDSYAKFAADMGPHPGRGWLLDRKNNDGDYQPSNCRWARRTTQNRNRRYGPKRRLTEKLVKAIRREDRPGTGSKYRGNRPLLAKKYGVSLVTIHEIMSNKTWQL